VLSEALAAMVSATDWGDDMDAQPDTMVAARATNKTRR